MGLTKTRKLLLRMFVDFTCEECNLHEEEVGQLEPHRINQGMNYFIRNIKMVCHNCHEKFSSAQRIANRSQGR